MNRNRPGSRRLVGGCPRFDIYLWVYQGRKYVTFDWHVEAFVAAVVDPPIWKKLGEELHEMFNANRGRLNRRAELMYGDLGGIGCRWPADLAERAVAILQPPLEVALRAALADGPALRRRYWIGDEPLPEGAA